MCQSLQTAKGQEFIPDFLKDLDGTSVTVPPRGVDVPLADGAREVSIRQRRERIKQAQENPGSMKPTLIRTRKDIMDEIT